MPLNKSPIFIPSHPIIGTTQSSNCRERKICVPIYGTSQSGKRNTKEKKKLKWYGDGKSHIILLLQLLQQEQEQQQSNPSFLWCNKMNKRKWLIPFFFIKPVVLPQKYIITNFFYSLFFSFSYLSIIQIFIYLFIYYIYIYIYIHS